MNKMLLVVDVQNDFVTGALGSPQAQAVLPFIEEKIEAYRKGRLPLVFTRDSHGENYLETQEGRRLPVPHCIVGSEGQEIVAQCAPKGETVIDKPTFSSFALAEQLAQMAPGQQAWGEIELCGLYTDICVVANALLLKTRFPETTITVDAKACAGITDEAHKAALLVMKMCQVNVLNT